jgi:hypothetical protein
VTFTNKAAKDGHAPDGDAADQHARHVIGVPQAVQPPLRAHLRANLPQTFQIRQRRPVVGDCA